MVALKIKWNKLSYDDFVIEPQKGVAHLKQKIYELTGVPADRQKLMAKGAWLGTLKDDAGDSKTRNISFSMTQFYIVTYLTSAYQNFSEGHPLVLVVLSLLRIFGRKHFVSQQMTGNSQFGSYCFTFPTIYTRSNISDLSEIPFKEGHQVMLMGTADIVVLPTEKTVFLEDMTDTQKAEKVKILMMF